MSTSFLYRRLVADVPGSTGTLSEPDGTPEPRFALQGTVNWMRALAILAENQRIGWSSMQLFYTRVQKANLLDPAVNTVFEQLLMSLHHLAALHAMVKADSSSNFARVAVMTWYYGVYCAANAMIAAQAGSLQHTHGATANQWDRHIAEAGLIPRPFNFRLTTMVEKDADAELAILRNESAFTINSRPGDVNDAVGACASYLSGTRAYCEGQIKEDLIAGDLKKRNLSNFRSKEAQKLRDDRLDKKTLGFLHQAFRYRGKANYRDALFLTYQAQVSAVLKGFIEDAAAVLQAFLSSAGAFCSRRLTNADWDAFVKDLNGHLALAVMPKDIWS